MTHNIIILAQSPFFKNTFKKLSILTVWLGVGSHSWYLPWYWQSVGNKYHVMISWGYTWEMVFLSDYEARIGNLTLA